MAEENLPDVITTSFEGLKQTNDFGAEYWTARDLQPLLGYNHWRSFENAVRKPQPLASNRVTTRGTILWCRQNGRHRLRSIAEGG